MSSSPLSGPKIPPLYIYLLSMAATLVSLIFLLPYTIGYGFERISISRQLEATWGTEEWQHCWLVPIACLAIIYLKKDVLKLIPVKGSLYGLFIIVFSLALYWSGYRVDNVYGGYAALQLFIAGSIIWLLGWKWMAALAFPWIFLVFAWPLPFLENMIAFPLRMIMSKSSVAVLNFLGVPVILQGTGILSAPDALTGIRAGQRFSVDVADPCSGIRSLFALMMVSALYGQFTLKTWWQKWVLFLCSIPLAVLGNLCRILMLTFGTMAMGPAVAIGTLENPSFFHMAAGYVVFAVALGGMLAVGWLLQMLPIWIGKQPVQRIKEAATVAEESPVAGKSSSGKKADPY